MYLEEVVHSLEWADHMDNRLEVGTMVGFVVDSQGNDCVVVDNCHDIGVEEADLVGNWAPVVVALGPAVVLIEHLGAVDLIRKINK